MAQCTNKIGELSCVGQFGHSGAHGAAGVRWESGSTCDNACGALNCSQPLGHTGAHGTKDHCWESGDQVPRFRLRTAEELILARLDRLADVLETQITRIADMLEERSEREERDARANLPSYLRGPG